MPRTISVLLFALLIAPCAFGDSTGQTNWSLLPSGGTYTWDGNPNDPLYGTGIGVSSVAGVGTADNNGTTLAIQYGSLDFTSGAYNGTLGSTWSWGAGGVLNLTGCIAGVTGEVCDGTNNVNLLSDDFDSVSIVPVVQLGQFGFDVVFGNLQGNLNPTVASFFGLSDSFTATSLNLLFKKGTPGSSLYGTNIGGRITATSSVAVPEEWGAGSTLGLFGFAFVAFGAAWRLGFLKPVIG